MANSRQGNESLKFFGRTGATLRRRLASFSSAGRSLQRQSLQHQFLAGAFAAGAAAAAGAADAAAGGAGLAGLIQQARMRSSIVSTFGSMLLPCRMMQRNAAWMCALGHPNRSYRSRWRNAVSRSSLFSSPTARRPS